MATQNSNFQAQESIRNAIRQIALKGIVNEKTGAVIGTGKTVGYVAKIHTEEDDELFGTIDVQEYSQLSMDEENEMHLGYHEGVFISALQDNFKGFVIIPLLYSDVVIDKDNDTGQEYVVMFSHVQRVQIDSHESVTVGVKKRKKFTPAEDDPDIHELEETGTFTKTTYTEDCITSEVHKDTDSHFSHQILDGEKFEMSIDDNATQVTVSGNIVNVVRDQSTISVDASAIEHRAADEYIKVSAEGVEVGGGEDMEEAVLGQKLVNLLSQLLTILGSAMTTTMLGTQPLIPAGQIAALQNQLKPFLSTHVKIQN